MKIRLLPDSLINRIAAGEVVERPASVVKELIENSLDAGASRVEVEVGSSGKDLIRVRDDGCGMSREDALLAIERHATSKLPEETALDAIETLGFRGEALPSIAAVSKLLVLTREKGSLSGTRLTVEAGRVESVEDAGCPEGTMIEARDLFFNTPARLKFMKSDSTEMARIAEAVTLLALSRQEAAFRLASGPKEILQAEAGQNRFARVLAVLGRGMRDKLHEAGAAQGPFSVSGFGASPDASYSNQKGIYLFVNRRPVRDRTMISAAIAAYRGLLGPGRYPVCVAWVSLPFQLVDVNVHPQKTEVRFADASMVYNVVYRAFRDMLSVAPWVRGAKSTGEEAASREPTAGRPYGGGGRPGFREAGWLADLPSTGTSVPVQAEMMRPSGRFSSLRYIGQFGAMYLVCEASDRLVLVDQHAAAERVAFDRMMKAVEGGGARPSQLLLVPEVVELQPAQAELLGGAAEELANLGLEIEPFGRGSFAVKAVPEAVAGCDARRLLLDCAEEMAETAKLNVRERLLHVMSRIACHSVIRGRTALRPEEAEALLRAMDGVDFSANCPHGRPVVREFGLAEVGSWFGRR